MDRLINKSYLCIVNAVLIGAEEEIIAYFEQHINIARPRHSWYLQESTKGDEHREGLQRNFYFHGKETNKTRTGGVLRFISIKE